MYAGWLRAVRRGHARAHRGLDVAGARCWCSRRRRSGAPQEYDERVSSTDIVLDVEQIRKWAHKLADHVTVVAARGRDARRDLLSPEPARGRAFDEITRWLDAYVPDPAAPDPSRATRS